MTSFALCLITMSNCHSMATKLAINRVLMLLLRNLQTKNSSTCGLMKLTLRLLYLMTASTFQFRLMQAKLLQLKSTTMTLALCQMQLISLMVSLRLPPQTAPSKSMTSVLLKQKRLRWDTGLSTSQSELSKTLLAVP